MFLKAGSLWLILASGVSITLIFQCSGTHFMYGLKRVKTGDGRHSIADRPHAATRKLCGGDAKMLSQVAKLRRSRIW